MKFKQAPVITIDGASGTGKGTISQMIANRLGWKFLDSGALYRVLALAAQKHGVALNNEADLKILGEHLDVQFLAQENAASTIILEGEDVTEAIRTEPVGNAASIIATLAAVRTSLLKRQIDFREAPGLVADGRDMGTVVFPDADLKIFLEASPKVRALRRYDQLKESGINATLSDLIEELHKRDERDQKRTVAPLKPAADAIRIDTDRLSIDQVVERIIFEINRKKAFPAISDTMTLKLAEVGIAE